MARLLLTQVVRDYMTSLDRGILTFTDTQVFLLEISLLIGAFHRPKCLKEGLQKIKLVSANTMQMRHLSISLTISDYTAATPCLDQIN